MSDPTPRDLELLRSFVNTINPDTHIDQLDTPERLRAWLVDRSLLAVDVAIDDEAHREALEFREAVRALALANCATELDPAAISSLNRLGADSSISVLMSADGHAELHAVGDGLHQTFGHLLSLMYTAMVDGSFVRLKGCANDNCQWLFYDQSKNRSKKWCEMQTCGNAINARAYRERHRYKPAAPSPQEQP
jgi:predicted RNA-binding Zn ribbon-like protein